MFRNYLIPADCDRELQRFLSFNITAVNEDAGKDKPADPVNDPDSHGYFTMESRNCFITR